MKDEHQALQELLDISAQLIQKIAFLDSFVQDYDTGVPLYLKEKLTIQAIGKNPGINVTRLAERMGVTKGAVSQTATKLVRKKLVRKTYSEDNAKEIILQLTDSGWTVFNAREKLIKDFIDMARNSLGDAFNPKLGMLVSVMTIIDNLLAKYVSQAKGN